MSKFKIDLDVRGSLAQGEAVLVYLPEQLVEEKSSFSQERFKNLIVLNSPLPSTEDLEEFSEALVKGIKDLGVKRATIIGVRGGGVIAQAITLADRKLCRRLVLINPSTRLEPGFFQSVIDFVERVLPFGLPLRLSRGEFDSRSYAHRIDCPALVLTCSDSTSYEKRQAKQFQYALPNVWNIRCESQLYGKGKDLSGAICDLVEEFMNIPPRRPQKNLGTSLINSQINQSG